MHFLLLLLLVNLTIASPQRNAIPEAGFGVEFDSNNTDSLPLLKLPYGAWRAYQYDSEDDVSHSTTSHLVMRWQHRANILVRYIHSKTFALLLRHSDPYDLQRQHHQYLICPLSITAAMVPFADKVRHQVDLMFLGPQMSIR